MSSSCCIEYFSLFYFGNAVIQLKQYVSLSTLRVISKLGWFFKPQVIQFLYLIRKSIRTFQVSGFSCTNWALSANKLPVLDRAYTGLHSFCCCEAPIVDFRHPVVLANQSLERRFSCSFRWHKLVDNGSTFEC